MQRISSISQIQTVEKGCVLTIGNFDGVHVGHQQILTAARQAAMDRKTQLLVMTFEPHPLAIVRPEMAPGSLTPLDLKERLIAQFGADYLFVVESTPELLALSAEDFVQRFLIENIKPGLVVEGESFNFGSGRSGSIHTLQELADANGFEVSVITAEQVGLSAEPGVTVSSTIIRNLLAEGSVADAATALGRPYRLIERIIPGRGKGRRLGFPTANMKLPQQAIPAEGVYAGFVELADMPDKLLSAKAKIPAALSIGTSATFGDAHSLLIEAHLLRDNVGQLYDKHLAIDFVQQIRPQQRFETESALAVQIAKDCKEAKEVLAGYEAH
ncbi:MAG: bifunctional riboflavin kinase/FAD synthetase [Phycisphaerae bacterium]|nr:bifunctional riboflavin kinase/FAD synthetase [Phycisphaerae bacterium]